MKKSKSLFAAILAVLSIGLVSCGNENNPSQPSNNPTTPSNNSQTPSVKNSYTFDVNGELKEGMTVTLIFKNNGSAIVEQASVVYSVDDASKATVSGNKITFTGNGTVKITATYKGETIEKTVEVAEGEHIYTIAEAKAANSNANKLIKMRGKVTASLGTSAYISDSTGGAYIYNWLFNNADTAITNKSFTVGQTVDITAFIVHSNSKDKNGNQNERGLQISNYNSGSRVSGTSAIVSTTEVEAMKPIELDEAGYKALTYDKVGNLYTFEAEYVSGKPFKGTGVNVKFKLGNTDIVLRTDKFDPAAPSDTLVAGKKYKITAPLSWFNGAQFAYASSGVSIVDADAKPLEVSYTGDAYVGKEVTLVTTANGVKVTEGVTYTIEEGSDLASLENDVLTITGEGTIKVKATYVKDGKTLTAEVTINATALALSKLSELKSMTSGKVKSRGYVMGYTGTPRIDSGLYDKVFIADGEDYFILYKVKPEQLNGINVGDLIEFTGDILHFKQGDVTTYETKNNVITKFLTEADSSIVKPTATELTSTSAAFAFGQANISKAYKINQGVVVSNTEDSSGNMTVKFTLGSNEYELFMDSRDYDITKDPFTKLTAGAVFNADVFAAASNFFCPSNIEITSQQEVLTLDKEEGTINIHGNDKTLQLNATYGGTNTAPIVWSSSVESVATVDQNGLVTGVAVGETIITAKKSETLSVQAKITVVDENITKVTISASDLTEAVAGAVNQEVKGIKIEISTGLVNVANIRVYKGQTLKLTSNIGLMTKVVFTCIASGDANHGPGGFTGTNYTAGEEQTGTWELAAGASSLTLTASKQQVRITQMEISYIPSAE